MGPVANTLNPPLLGLAAHIWAGIHVFGLRPERRAGEEPFWTRRDSTATRQRLGGGTASARAELPSAQKQRSSAYPPNASASYRESGGTRAIDSVGRAGEADADWREVQDAGVLSTSFPVLGKKPSDGSGGRLREFHALRGTRSKGNIRVKRGFRNL
ncbi:hypothetical protein B0H12DRAFT_1078940 [Mycena haematopus]|nr:hypothetical protein B0H12DRAFT_1078940 [Mycena haematopus]